ncbi:nucleotidyltransferase domain-containing protein [Merismopedia glauca]|uniref:Nucleotidyltransferase family protein n=1 Tax=Merismopedia glauca CCAP 1448/3 TaxID=1296344 RepID=A0A2T1C414_9CYAN|nr:nucleotidyltransferase family protein [Merismopedia glauca]PSB02887.1 hypothetical protein C7B64_10995 [Merismopedia glauca CCAP 1448/3]
MMTNLKVLPKPLATNISSEGELFLCCVQTGLDPTINKRIQALVAGDIDWNHLLQIAEKHRLIQLLYCRLNTTCPQAVPPPVFRDLRGRFYANSRQNLVITNELSRLLDMFQERGIRVIPYKGTILANSVYGKLSLRQVYDIDLLVHQQDFHQSRELLISLGYLLKEKFDREHSFSHPDTKIEVDLHWGLTPFYFPLEIDFEAYWQRVQPVALFERSVFSFSAEDLLVILCIQIAKDCWEREQQIEHLAKVCDIAKLLETNKQLDWEQVIQQAVAIGAVRMLWFGLLLARNLFDATLPEEILVKIQADSTAIDLVEQVCASLFTDADDLSTPQKSLFDIKFRLKQLIFYLKMRERLADKSAHIWHILQTFSRI